MSPVGDQRTGPTGDMFRRRRAMEKASSTECPVCFERYGNSGSRLPKVLSCDHVLCLSCADRMRDKSGLECPLCRQLTYTERCDQLADEPVVMDKVSRQIQCNECSSRLGVDRCTHCDRNLCAECRDEHIQNGLVEGLVLLAKALFYIFYYKVKVTYWLVDRLLRCTSWLFTKVGIGLVSVAYIYLAYVMTAYIVRYVQDRVPTPCVLPWAYDHFYWYSTKFDLPWEVTISTDGHVIISDLNRNSISDLTGDFLYDLGADTNVGRGLAVDNNGNTFVSVGREVHVFDTGSGKPKTRITLRGDFDMVRGLAVHRKFLYACAGQGFNVLKINGSHVMRYNLPVTPHFLAVSPTNDIVISDASSVVLIYRQKLPEMNQLHQKKEIQAVWLSPGFTRPGGVVVDCDGYVVVSDVRSGRLVKFDSDGEFVGYVTEPKNLKKPQGLALSTEGDIIVCDHGLGLVMRFSSRCRHSAFTRLLGIPWCSLITGQLK